MVYKKYKINYGVVYLKGTFVHKKGGGKKLQKGGGKKLQTKIFIQYSSTFMWGKKT